MYKPLQKKNSSWTPTTAQKKSKSASKLGHFSIQPKPQQKSSQSLEIGEYSRDSADRLAANVMRSLEAKDSQETETPTVQPQSESRISVADVVGQRMPSVMAHPLTPLQRKLTVGQPGDKYEQEADTVAAKVVEQINSPTSQQPVQGKVEPVAQPTVMRDGGVGGGAVDDSVEQSIQSARGSGQGLSEDIKEPMEQAFGADFSGVRVHNNSNADQLNRSLNAQAFTTGQDIFFKQGEYSPASRGGQELLAHELTHVVQQNGGVVQQKNKQPQDSNVSLKEIPNLNKIRRKSEVLTHLQSLKGKTNQYPSVYLNEIEKFQKLNSTEKIPASQRQVLELANSVDVQHKDYSKTLRRQASPRLERSTFPAGTTLGVDVIGNTTTQGFIQGLDSNDNHISLFHSQKVNYFKKQYNRDYVVVAEGDERNKIVRLQLGIVKEMTWGDSANMVFWEDSVTNQEGTRRGEGVLQYGAGEVRAVIQVPDGVDMIDYDTTYPVKIPDYPHSDASTYGLYSDVWFRIEGAPQDSGDEGEYIHRGDYSAGCISVQQNWPDVFKHIVTKRLGEKYVGTVTRRKSSNRDQ